MRAAALEIIYNVSRGVQFLAPVAITFVAARSSFGAGIALAAPFALLAGASVWALPETKGVKLTPVVVRSAEASRYTGSASLSGERTNRLEREPFRRAADVFARSPWPARTRTPAAGRRDRLRAGRRSGHRREDRPP